jgi:hypothetical protein
VNAYRILQLVVFVCCPLIQTCYTISYNTVLSLDLAQGGRFHQNSCHTEVVPQPSTCCLLPVVHLPVRSDVRTIRGSKTLRHLVIHCNHAIYYTTIFRPTWHERGNRRSILATIYSHRICQLDVFICCPVTRAC